MVGLAVEAAAIEAAGIEPSRMRVRCTCKARMLRRRR